MIDLGVLPAAGADDPPPPPAPAACRPRWPVGWVAAGLAALVLLTATAASPPQPPWAVPHFTVPAGEQTQAQIVLTDDTLYVLGHFPRGGSTVAAYRLSDGTLRWQQTADQAFISHGKPMLAWDGQEGDATRTAWLDPQTGEPQWQGEGHPRAVSDDRVLVSVPHLRPDPTVGDEQRWRSSLTAIDRHSAREVWSLPPVDDWSYVEPESGQPDRVVTVDGNRLNSYDLATGTRLATTELTGPQQLSSLEIIGQMVVLIRQHVLTQVTLSAYDMDTLDQLWSQESEPGIWHLSRCGELVCVHRSGFEELTALDPATGEQRWSQPSQAEGFVDAGWLAGYLVASDVVDESSRLLDAATGEVVFDLGEWQPHFWDGRDALVTRYDPNRQPVTVELGRGRQEVRFAELGRTWFAKLHLDPAPRLELLGAVDSGFGSCTSGTGTAGTGYLACTGHEEVRVWRVR